MSFKFVIQRRKWRIKGRRPKFRRARWTL